jgi:MinD superfamily P-loop ATPase
MSMVDFTKAQATAIPYIDDDKCAACRRCMARTVCKSKAIMQLDPGEPPFIDSSRCYACHICLSACPYEAIVRNRRK